MISLDHASPVARFVHETLGPDFPHADDIACALDFFCQDHCADRALTRDYLSLLLSRVLVKSGAPHAARRLLPGNADGTDACLDALAQDQCPHRVMAGLSARLVRPTRWWSSGDCVVWLLDFRRLKPEPLAALELGMTQALRALLDEAAPLWDGSSGRGGMALRGLDNQTIDRREIVAFCRSWLEATARRRGWTSTPSLLLLDTSS